MVQCVCSPVIDAEMDDWTALGGGNSGCCGNQKHTYGFHLAGGNVPVTDYSRRHEPGRPYNMSWACAGDFSHKNNPALRAMHAVVLTRLMRGELPMICEFIGQPWPDQPVYYWSRWENKLKRYTGQGHDHWSHISWWRSRANQRAFLWVPEGALPVVPTVPVVFKPKPAAPGKLVVDGDPGPKTIRRLQQYMGTPQDGVISRVSSVTKAVQRHLNAKIGAGLRVDGEGLWFDGRKSLTIRALQRYLRTPVDGRITRPRSMAVQELQRRLNNNTF